MNDDKVYLGDNTFIRKDVLVSSLLQAGPVSAKMTNIGGQYRVGDTFRTTFGGIELRLTVTEVIGDELLLGVDTVAR